MDYRHFLNLAAQERDKNIYRVMPFLRLMELIRDRRNTLTKPCLWNDPFENFILQGKGLLRNGQIVRYGMRDSLYGQCWTLRRESDAMWRIYSNDSEGVKIRTTIRKLYSSLYEAANPSKRDVSCFIGKVVYLGREAIRSYLTRPINLESSGVGVVETLLVKRIAFSHEKEVRLIYWADENNATADLFRYRIDPYDLIEEVVFDSRLDVNSYRRHKEELRALRYEGRIVQSGLYKAPKNIFTIIS